MSGSDRQLFKTATVLDQQFLNDSHDNLSCQLETIVDIEAPDGSIIHASDRNKYVGSVFYEALGGVVFQVSLREVIKYSFIPVFRGGVILLPFGGGKL